MANFLSNLVDRFTEQAEVVRARPLSMFEPQKESGLSAKGTADQPATEAVKGVDDRQAGDPIRDAMNLAVAPMLRRWPQETIKPGAIPIPPLGKTNAEEQAGSGPPARSGYLIYQPASQLDRPLMEPLQVAMVELDARRKVLRELESGAIPETGAYAKKGREAPDQIAQPINDDTETPIQPNRSEPLKSPMAKVFSKQILNNKDLSPAEPVINVTIGRVDVIAVPPSEPVKTPKPISRSQVLSLDEYLNRRDEERQK